MPVIGVGLSGHAVPVVTAGDPGVVANKAALQQLEEEDRLKQILSGIPVSDPQSRVQLAQAASNNPLLARLLPFSPDVVLQDAARSADLERISQQASMENKVSSLLDSLVGPQSVDLGGGPSGRFAGQRSFTNADLPVEQAPSARQSLDALRTEGLLNPADFLQGAQNNILAQALEKLGLGKGKDPGSEFLKIILRDALSGKREAAKEEGVERRHKDNLELRKDLAQSENIRPKEVEEATRQLQLKAQAGAPREELDRVAQGLGFRITGMFRDSITIPGLGQFVVPGGALDFTLEPIQRPAIQKRSGGPAASTQAQGDLTSQNLVIKNPKTGQRGRKPAGVPVPEGWELE